MSTKHLLFVVMILTLPTSNLFSQQGIEKVKGGNEEDEKTAVAHVENEWLDALNKADVNAIAEILAEDFSRPAPDSGQFVNKRDLLGYYRAHLSPLTSGQKRIEGMTVTLYGSTALARGVLTSANSGGQIIRKLLFTDVFVKRAGKWQAISAQENVVPLTQVPTH